MNERITKILLLRMTQKWCPKLEHSADLLEARDRPRFPHGKMPTVILITVGQVSYSEVSLEKDPESKTHRSGRLVGVWQSVSQIPSVRLRIYSSQNLVHKSAILVTNVIRLIGYPECGAINCRSSRIHGSPDARHGILIEKVQKVDI
jgi:hypothetical protein